MTESTVGAFNKKHQLSVEEAQTLIQKEKDGSGRKFVLKMLATQARNAKRRRHLKEAEDTLISTV